MVRDKERDPWLFCTSPNRNSALRLFCLPFSGGGASFYRDWPAAMGVDIDVRAIQLPGRETRYHEPREADPEALVKRVVEAIAPLLDRPFAIFGYSLGALLAFEVCRELRRQNRDMPVCLFVAAMRAPHTPAVHPPLSRLPDDQFLQQIDHYYQPQNEAWKIPEIQEMLLPVLRDDFAMADKYIYHDEQPLPCHVQVFAGEDDIGAPPELTRRWSEQTSQSLDYHMYPGGHFFIDTVLADVQKVVRETLLTSMTDK